MVVDGKLRFWNDHKARIREAAAALYLAIPDYFWGEELEENLLQLARQRNAANFGRLKLKVWRAGEGLYTPHTNDIEWLATAAPTQPIPYTSIKVGISQMARTCLSPLSHFKGPHAPLYVLAGIEKQNRNLDDILLLNAQGHVAELISSNIFWLKDGVLYTPTVDTGCVNGILRRNILRWCQNKGIAVQEVLAAPDELLQADMVFSTNVTGIRSMKEIDTHTLPSCNDWLQNMRAELQV
ncbi:branched-chain amino acid aminotransferase/4-amino-4-deoxychorismate lyase [Pontibacter ramchanderi]|uniref:branched-chain-amino-acid transaminase n=2 Tax=Pontibacter ramchanderi TaxID=1179743 RepID=A0A2N3V1M2_9BACT|nr:branched-chain amino acid aminotransferase/4-amino-4-deoxychorismate lyase [Pontibacter ramchanderi]